MPEQPTHKQPGKERSDEQCLPRLGRRCRNRGVRTVRVAIYTRVSTSEQATDGASLDIQREQCRNLIAMRGWSLTGEFVDGGVSGADPQRVELDRLMVAARSGSLDAIVVAKLDRLGRSLRHLSNLFAELDDLGVAVVSVAESLDSSTPTGRLMRHQLSSFAEFERDRITERMVEGLRRTVESGFWPGGPAPYGYSLAPDPGGSKHKVVAIAENQRDLLRLVYNLLVKEGHTTYSAARYLNAEGYRTIRGRLWRHNNLCFRLRKTHLKGTWTYNQGDEPIELAIPVIFTPEEWDQLQASIKGTPRPQRKNRLYPLTGRGRVHLRCDCGGNYFGKRDTSKKGRAYYECSRNHHALGDERCRHRPRIIRAPDLEAAVWNQVVGVLTNEDYLLELASAYLADISDDTDYASELRGTEAKLTNLGAQETRIVRKLAEQDELHALTGALQEIAQEQAALVARLDDLNRRHALQLDEATMEQQLRNLADTARDRLLEPTPELMSKVFDLLHIDLVRTSSDLFEGTGTIPLPRDGGEVWEEGLLPRGPRRPRCGPVSGGGHDGAGSSRSPHLPLLRSVGEPPSEPHDRSGGARQHLRRSRCAHRLLFPATAH